MFFKEYLENKDKYKIREKNPFDIHCASSSLGKNYKAKNEDFKYKNVKFVFPIYENKFHSCLGYEVGNFRFIPDSNSYIEDKGFQNNHHRRIHYDEIVTDVFSRINYTYDALKKSNPEEFINEEVVSFMTPFDCVNFGHNLSMILSFLHRYFTLKLTCKIVISKYSMLYPRLFEILQLFFTDDQIIFIENDKVYQFKSIYFFPTRDCVFNILQHEYLIEEIKIRTIRKFYYSERGREEKEEEREKYFDRNIFIVKNSNQNAIITSKNVYKCDQIMDILEKSNWVIINPETMNMLEIIMYSIYAKNIVTSFGGIFYGNGIFFNRFCNKYILLQHGEKIYFRENEFTPLYFPTDLDSVKDNFFKSIKLKLNGNCIIGYTGFVGLNLMEHLEDVKLYNSTNIDDIKGKYFDRIYFSGLYAEKWKINQNGKEDEDNIEKIKEALKQVYCKEFILISTIDIYQSSLPSSSVIESAIGKEEINEDSQNYASHPYGKNRKDFEDFVKSRFNCYIIRLSGLFGQGLKKNVIYDLLHNNEIEKISLHTSFQWYNIKRLYKDIQKIVENGWKEVNLVNEPIQTRELVQHCFPGLTEKCKGDSTTQYNIQTKWKNTKYFKGKFSVLNEIHDYVVDFNKQKMKPYKPIVSNIAWSKDVGKILNHFNIKGIEIAPTKLCDWDSLGETSKDITGFPMVSCQSLLFNTGIKNIFLQEEEFLNHCEKIIPILSKMGIKTIVFGSPKQRELIIPLFDAIKLFHKIGDICDTHNVFFCIEPNSKAYGCKWLNTLDEVKKFVNQVNHSNIKINFDTGNYTMENDKSDVKDKSDIKSIQISSPHLVPFNKEKPKIPKSLFKNYHGNVSLEMKETNTFDLIKSLYIFINST